MSILILQNEFNLEISFKSYFLTFLLSYIPGSAIHIRTYEQAHKCSIYISL